MNTSSTPTPFTGVLEAAVYAEDLGAARDFYGGTLGLEEVTAAEGRHVFFRCGRTMVLVFNPVETRKQPLDTALPVPAHGPTGQSHICFTVNADAIEHWEEYLQSQDVEIEARITWPNGARSVYFRDPAGNSLEFAEPKLWGYDLEGEHA